MYTLPNKLKLFAIIFMVVGAIGIVSGFLNAPANTAEVKEMLASHGDGHGAEATHEVSNSHGDDGHGDAAAGSGPSQ